MLHVVSHLVLPGYRVLMVFLAFMRLHKFHHIPPVIRVCSLGSRRVSAGFPRGGPDSGITTTHVNRPAHYRWTDHGHCLQHNVCSCAGKEHGTLRTTQASLSSCTPKPHSRNDPPDVTM